MSTPVFRVPPFKIEAVYTAKSQLVDWGLTLLGIPTYWKQTRGKGVKVAILDTGIAPNHPDLTNAWRDARDFAGSQYGASDAQGHGTHCAGIIAARDDAGGVIGVAPECDLYVGKVLGDNGSGDVSAVVAGIRWAIDKKVDVLSMSLGSSAGDEQLEGAIKAALAAGIVVVAAAGNEGPSLDTIGYPAKYDGVISVGAIDRQRRVTNFSSRGKRVDICAPGDQITSCWPPSALAKLSGTSMATPFVAGVVALCVAQHKLTAPKDAPRLTPAQMLDLVRKTAVDLGAPGFDTTAGFGLIDPGALLAASSPPDQPPPTPLGMVSFGAADFSASGLAKAKAIFGAGVTIDLRGV